MITIEVIHYPDLSFCREMEKVHKQMFPSGHWTIERFFDVLRQPNVVVVAAKEKNKVVGIVTLIEVKSFSRTVVFFEECIVDSSFQNKGVCQKLCEAAFEYVKEHTAATRIEGTANENNSAAWNAYLKAGFFDRKNRTFLKAIER